MLCRRLVAIPHNSVAAAARLLSAAAAARPSSSTTTATTDRKKPAISQRVRFIDRLRVTAKGGHGGGGSGALFGRTGHHPRAAGGNGAAGGSVILRATRQLTGLGSIPLAAQATRGGNGGKQWMDGAKGPDTLVQVPLGTLVWRLLQVSGGPARPHGITATLPPGNSPPAEGAVASTHGGNSSSNGSRRRSLFPSAAQAEAGHPPAAAAGLAPAHGSDNPAAASDVGSHCSSSGSRHHSSTAEESGEFVDELYKELVSCRRLLSNAQKLHLLHTGRLASAAQLEKQQQQQQSAASAMLDAGSEAEESEDEGEGSGDDSQSPGGLWSQQQQQRDGFEDDDDVAAHRQFSKAQVWSILQAQAELLGELDQPGQQLLVAQGGRGGRGNAASTQRQAAPASRQRSDGWPGEEVLLLLRLRLLADVVLVGLPNVGKSSLIAALTGARAQVGSYAFTTLRPQLGVVTDWGSPTGADQQQQQQWQQQRLQQQSFPIPTGVAEAVPPAGPTAAAADAADAITSSGDGGHGSSRQLVIADLPGLVPGAHAGRGRGTAFLAHLERAACLALVLDMTGTPGQQQQQQQQQQQEGEAPAGAAPGASEPPSAAAAAALEAGEVLVPYSPAQQLAILQEELAAHDSRVLQLPMVVVANKIDRLSPEAAAAEMQRLKAATRLPIVPVSAKEAMGLGRLKQALQLLVPPR